MCVEVALSNKRRRRISRHESCLIILYSCNVATRLETVNLRKIPSVAKVVGTAVTVSGAMVMTLYKGPALQFIKGQAATHHESGNSTQPSEQNWVLGTVELIASCGGWASFFILQV